MAIKLEVHLRDNLEESEVRASGFELMVVNDEAMELFGLPRQVVGRGSHPTLWPQINNWWGRYPDEFVTSDPVIGSHAHRVPNEWTPYHDAWGEANQVRIEKKAVGARLIESTGSTDAINSTSIMNHDNAEQPDQSASLTYRREVTDERYTENAWSWSLMNGLEVEVGGEYAGFNASATRKIEFTVGNERTSGKAHTDLEGRELSLTASVNAAPRTQYPVSIQMGQGALRIEVDYEYRLMGQWRALYIQKAYNGSLTSPPASINELLEAEGLPQVVRDSEVMNIGFVTHGAISIGEGRPL